MMGCSWPKTKAIEQEEDLKLKHRHHIQQLCDGNRFNRTHLTVLHDSPICELNDFSSTTDGRAGKCRSHTCGQCGSDGQDTERWSIYSAVILHLTSESGPRCVRFILKFHDSKSRNIAGSLCKPFTMTMTAGAAVFASACTTL